jgi:putative peptidoglycan lipid II flippase
MLRSARLISFLTLISRVLGLARDIALANTFGLGSVASAFGTAFQVPNLFRRLFGEGALSAASIPVLTEKLAREGEPAADQLAGRILSLLVLLLAGLTIVGELVIAGLYLLYGEQRDNAVVLTLTALMLPYMIFICTAALLGGVQNVFGRFASAAAAPIILNLFMIAALLAAPRMYPAGASGEATTDGRLWLMSRQAALVALAVVVSGVFQMAWQWAAARRIGLRLPLSLSTRDAAVRRIGITMLPMVAGLAAVQINTLLDTLIAWWFVPREVVRSAVGPERVGPDILAYAQRLYQFPLGVFATALATAIFPALSRHAAENDLPGLGRTLSRGLRIASFEGIPSLVGLILIREPLVRLLFGHGEFGRWPEAVDRVSTALFMYALGIWAFGVNQIVVRAFYSIGDARTPLWISVRNVGLNLVLNLVLVQTALREAGLALATSICAVLQVVLLLRRFSAQTGHFDWASIRVSVARTLAATAIMAVSVLLTDRMLGHAPAVLQVGVLVGVGAAAFAVAAWALRAEEMREMLRRG